jgi:cyclopropane-fatty-acyl-phospholipid synthase
MINKRITHKFLKVLEAIHTGFLTITLPDGSVHYFSGENDGAKSQLVLYDWSVIPRFLLKGDVGFAECYRDGKCDTNDLAELLLVILQNSDILRLHLHGSYIARLSSQIMYLFRSNTIKGSKKNIHAHYDLGNDFYNLWLDPSMTYSSAIFNTEHESLATAQNNKYDNIINTLDKNSGKILEIGCGWGGFAQRATSRGDYAIKGITISEQQYQYANHRLQDRANIALEDYRNQSGKYDHIVSIEMFEAVGERYWQTYFSKVKDLLSNRGKAVIQTITIRDDLFERYRQGADMIRTFIFPGGMLPSPAKFATEANKCELKVTSKNEFGLSYALTLQIWLNNFENKLLQIRNLGFDDRFIRIWRFYLAACIAGFKSGRISVMQVSLENA